MSVATLLSIPDSLFPPAPLADGAAPDTAAAAETGFAPAAAAPLRLTRRGRLVLIGLPVMLAAAAALTMVGFFTAPAMAASGGPDVTRTVQVSVGAGESLWGLAAEYAPDRDPREVVADIMELNNLSDARIPAGVQLFIPVER